MQIRTVGVLGCGLMGSGIAQVCAQAGYTTLGRGVSESLVQERGEEVPGACRGARATARERVRYHPR